MKTFEQVFEEMTIEQRNKYQRVTDIVKEKRRRMTQEEKKKAYLPTMVQNAMNECQVGNSSEIFDAVLKGFAFRAAEARKRTCPPPRTFQEVAEQTNSAVATTSLATLDNPVPKLSLVTQPENSKTSRPYQPCLVGIMEDVAVTRSPSSRAQSSHGR